MRNFFSGSGCGGTVWLVAALMACGAPVNNDPPPGDEAEPPPPITLEPLSYRAFKAIGLTPRTLPADASLARAYVDVDRNGQRLLFTAAIRYSFDQTPQTATPAEFAFWRDQGGTWVKDGALLPGGNTGCLHPRKAIVADFNGDSQDDVFVACHGWDTNPYPGEPNSVVLSQPDGKYLIGIANSAVGFFHSAAASDFNGDGRPDVVVTNNFTDPSAVFFLNAGDGTFVRDTATRLPNAVLGRRNFFTVEVLDVTEDGHADLFLAGHDWENAPTVVVVNPGNGNLRDGKVVTIPAVPNEGVVLDVVATGTGAGRTLWVLRTSGGDGTFYKSRVVQKVGWPGLASALAENQRPKRWTPWILPTVVSSTPVIASDDAAVDLAIPY